MQSHFGDGVSLDDLGIVVQFDTAAFISELEIRVFNKSYPIILGEHRLNDIDVFPLTGLI